MMAYYDAASAEPMPRRDTERMRSRTLIDVMPPIIRSHAFLRFAVTIVILIVLPGALLAAAIFRPSLLLASGSVVMSYLAVGSLVFFLAILWFLERVLLKRVVMSRFRLCGVCGFSMQGHSKICRCPDCGTPYSLNHLVSFWLTFLRQMHDRDRKIRSELISIGVMVFVVGVVWMSFMIRFNAQHARIMFLLYLCGFIWISSIYILIRSFLFMRRAMRPSCTVRNDKSSKQSSAQADGQLVNTKRSTWVKCARPKTTLSWQRDVAIPSRRAWEQLRQQHVSGID